MFNCYHCLLNLSFDRRKPNDLETFRNEDKQQFSKYGVISKEEKNQSDRTAQIGFSFLEGKSKQDFKIH